MITEESIRKNIDSIFNEYKLHYISYDGGSGGEFLIAKLRQYSPLYKTNIEYEYYDNNNRTRLPISDFFAILSFSRINNGNLNDLKDLIFRGLYRKSNCNLETVSEMVDYARTLLVKDQPNLCKLHLTSNIYFDKSNTWTIHIDGEEWFDYTKKLRYFKVFEQVSKLKHAINNNKANFWNSPSLSVLDEFNLWAQNKGITEIKEMYMACIMMPEIFKNFSSFEELLNTPSRDLYMTYRSLLDKNYNRKKVFYEEISKNTNRILFSRFFEPGYLEDMFSITDPNFRKELITWHENNLKLISDAGLDF